MASHKNDGAVDRWSEMLPDMLEEISDRLPLLDFFQFRGVCRRWRSAPSGRSGIASFSKDRPWLMFYGSDDPNVHAGGVCYLYSRPHPERCAFRLPHLRGATVLQSKSGWLFARRDEHFFLHNPFTLAKIDLPDHKVFDEQDATMTTLPTARGSLVFVVSRKDGSTVEVSSCRVGDTEWESRSVGIEKDEIGATLAVYPCRCVETDDGGDAPPPPSCCPRCRSRDKKSILILGSKRSSLYEHAQNRQTYYNYSMADDDAECRDRFWHEDFEDSCHRKDWLRTYGGEESILVSTCMLSTRTTTIPGAIGLCHATRVVAEDVAEGDVSEGDEDLKLVRASWIEPIFG